MKAKAWLILEIEETKRSNFARRSLKITGVRQSQPLDRLAVEVELNIPEEIIAPKVRLIAEHEEEVQLAFAPTAQEMEDFTDASTS